MCSRSRCPSHLQMAVLQWQTSLHMAAQLQAAGMTSPQHPSTCEAQSSAPAPGPLPQHLLPQLSSSQMRLGSPALRQLRSQLQMYRQLLLS